MARQHRSESGFDVVVIGAGVIGLAVAAELATRGRGVLILESDAGIARGVTSRNSEVVHAGLYYPPGSLKAELCVRGRELLYAYCESKRVACRRLGKLVVATAPSEEAVLEQILDRGRANGAPGLELIDSDEVARLEPEVRARQALFSPESGIVDAHALCLALLAQAEAAGAVLALEREVVALAPRDFGWQVDVALAGRAATDTNRIERIDAGIVVDAAGLAADSVAALAGLDVAALDWKQSLCKGDYFKLGPGHRIELSRLVYPVPQQAGLGIHATLDLAGRLRFGPDAVYLSASAPGVSEDAARAFDVDPAKAGLFRDAVARYLPALAEATFVPDYAGIRPKLAGPGESFRDFVVEETSAHGVPGFVACLGIESPGLTAALAIAGRVADQLSFG